MCDINNLLQLYCFASDYFMEFTYAILTTNILSINEYRYNDSFYLYIVAVIALNKYGSSHECKNLFWNNAVIELDEKRKYVDFML